MRLESYERLLIKKGANRYKVVGPGRVFMGFRDKALTTFNVGPQSQPFHFKNVRTQDDIPLNVTLRVSYRINPSLFSDDLLPRIPALNEGGWQETLHWQVEAVLQRSLPGFTWRDLGQEETQVQIERRLVHALAERVRSVGIEITDISLIKADLPDEVQKNIIRAERDRIAARLRATTLKEYQDVFGENELVKVLPYLSQLETADDNGQKPLNLNIG